MVGQTWSNLVKRVNNLYYLVRVVTSRVNAIHAEGRHEETKPIDNPISLPHVNLNRIIVPHYDALVLTLCINCFDVYKVLIDPSSAADLLQLLSFK